MYAANTLLGDDVAAALTDSVGISGGSRTDAPLATVMASLDPAGLAGHAQSLEALLHQACVPLINPGVRRHGAGSGVPCLEPTLRQTTHILPTHTTCRSRPRQPASSLRPTQHPPCGGGTRPATPPPRRPQRHPCGRPAPGRRRRHTRLRGPPAPRVVLPCVARAGGHPHAGRAGRPGRGFGVEPKRQLSGGVGAVRVLPNRRLDRGHTERQQAGCGGCGGGGETGEVEDRDLGRLQEAVLGAALQVMPGATVVMRVGGGGMDGQGAPCHQPTGSRCAVASCRQVRIASFCIPWTSLGAHAWCLPAFAYRRNCAVLCCGTDVDAAATLGDTRAAMAPLLAHRAFGPSGYSWMLYGDDDTLFFVQGGEGRPPGCRW